jgi:hypothetical protein
VPFTPFHMGPGLAVKAVGGRYFSVLVFGIAQVAMDIEPLVGMLRGAKVLHGWSHSYVGATVIGLVVMLLATPLCRLILRRWNRELAHYHIGWLGSPEGIGPLAAATGAFVGTYSHVVLDSIMHADITPFSPWSTANGLQGYLSINALHFVCVAAGLFGISAWLIVALWQRRRRREG